MNLSDLMKQHEHAFRRKVSPNEYLLVRLDGKAFHSYTKGLEKPYDTLLMDAMDQTTKALCEQIPGVRFAYVESDEISLAVTAFKNIEPSESNPTGVQVGDLWMGGTEAKMLSLSAAIATAEFNAVRTRQQMEAGKPIHKATALFDSRLWTFPGNDEGLELTKKYFMWRRKDSVKNSVTMAALDVFGHKAILSKNTDEKRAMLVEAGAPWEDLPDGFKYGRFYTKKQREETVSFVHGKTKETHSTVVQRGYWDGQPFSDLDSFMKDAPLPQRR